MDPAGYNNSLTCRMCGLQYGDPLYRGPFGHAPGRLCLDCWSAHWEAQLTRMHTGGPVRRAEEALALLCQGYTYRETAEILSVAPSSIRRQIRQLARSWQDLPEWFRLRIRRREEARHVA